MPASQVTKLWNLAQLLPEIARLPPHWALIPIGSNKQPQFNNWTHSRYSIEDFRSAASVGVFKGALVTPKGKPSCELSERACRAVGVLCGKPSGGLLFFDHDGASCDRLIQEVSGVSLKEALPKTPLVRSGRPGRYQLVYQIPEEFWGSVTTKKIKTGIKGDDGKPEQIEFRWDGLQSVVLGHHPQTGGYEWVYHPEEVPVAEAPLWMIEQMLEEEAEEETSVSPQKTWAKFDRDFLLPCTEVIPIEIALAPSTRKILEGSLSKGRNDSGIQLASDLVGTADYLDSIGQRYTGNPEELFFGWCFSQGLDRDQPKGQPKAIWKSAQKGKKAALTPEQIEGCVKSYVWKQQAGDRQIGSTSSEAEQEILEAELTPELLRGELERLGAEKDPFAAVLAKGAIQRKFHISAKDVEVLQHLTTIDSSAAPTMVDLIDNQFMGLLDQVGSVDAVGYQSQFPALNEIMGGIHKKDLALIAGRPAMGKSVLGIQLAYQFAITYQKPVICFCLEMESIQVLNRLIGALSNVPTGKIGKVHLSPDEESRVFQALTHLRDVPLSLDQRPRLTTELLRKRALETAKGKPIGAIFVDYLQLMTPDRYFPNANEKVSFFSRELKLIAGELDCPVVALSQLSRATESQSDKRPSINHLRESGTLEQDASQVILMYRDEYYNPGTPDRGVAEVIVGKNRHGPVGTAKLLFDSQYTRFRNT